MEKIMTALDEIQKISEAYQIPVKNIVKLRSEIATAKVCTPIIGKFSSGKSALVNTLLGYSRKILKEDILPETAVPVEITYTEAEDSIAVYDRQGELQAMSVDEYRGYEADAENVKNVRIQLRNSFLEEIPDVMLVDMPGFESGYEVHNRAIDDYLPQSMAYIIAFPADDPILRSSVGNILKELCLYEMPLCVVITKYDKRNDDFEDAFEKLNENLRRYVGKREIRFCRTSSFDGNAEELEEFLREIQEKSGEILAKKYKKVVFSILENLEGYLKTTLNSSRLSESELEEQEDKLHKQLETLKSQFAKEQNDFETEISECIEKVKDDIQSSLEAEESTMVTMTMNNQKIEDHINSVVRRAVTVSVKKHLIPKVEKYLKKVADTINSESIGDVCVSFTFDVDGLNKDMVAPIVTAVAAILLGLPILGTFAALVVGIVSKLVGNKKREEAKVKIRKELESEVFPKIVGETGAELERIVAEKVNQLNTSVGDELTSRQNALEKAMADIRVRREDEKARKDNLVADIKTSLERIEEIKDDLR